MWRSRCTGAVLFYGTAALAGKYRLLISNITRNEIQISGRKAYGTFVGEKWEHFFLPIFASDSVSLPRFDNPRNVSDKPQTMSGFPSVPSGTASQTI